MGYPVRGPAGDRLGMRAVMALVAGLFVVADPARAEDITGTILGSGIGANPSSGTARDSNWKIVALPYSGTGAYVPPGGQSLGYDAYVPKSVTASWLGSNGGGSNTQSGYTVSGSTYYWIAPDPDVTALSTALAPVSTGTESTWYKWIAAQTFTIPSDDNYYLNFPSAVDNRLGFYINGTIDTTDPRQPTIVGGNQIGVTSTASGQFTSITNNTNATPIFLPAGTHTAYMVLTDLGNSTGVLIGPSEFSTAPLPEPSTWALATAAGGALALMAWRKRLPRRESLRRRIDSRPA